MGTAKHSRPKRTKRGTRYACGQRRLRSRADQRDGHGHAGEQRNVLDFRSHFGILPTCASGSKSRSPSVRSSAANGLASVGWSAQAAVPVLVKCLGDQDYEARSSATNAVNSIRWSRPP